MSIVKKAVFSSTFDHSHLLDMRRRKKEDGGEGKSAASKTIFGLSFKFRQIATICRVANLNSFEVQGSNDKYDLGLYSLRIMKLTKLNLEN